MKSSLTKRFAAAAALAVLALGAAGAAHARDNVSFSIGISSPGFYGQSAPVYYPQQPVYVQPRPVYVQPNPVYYPPQTVYVQPPQYGYYYDSGRDWRRVEWERRQFWERNHHRRDWDRDGHR